MKKLIFLCFHFNFLLFTGVQPINNVVIVSGAQQSDSALHIHVHSLPNSLLIQAAILHWQSSMCYTVGPCWLPILNIAMWTCPSQTP